MSRTMGDDDGPLVARMVYSALFKDQTLDPDAIPYALDDAVRQLRLERKLPVDRWATYIHIGG